MPPERQFALVRWYAFEAVATRRAVGGLASAVLANLLVGVYHRYHCPRKCVGMVGSMVLPEGTR